MEASPGPWISALRHSHDRLRASVEPLGPDQLTQRSYPSEWTIAQVLSHLGSQAEIFGLILAAGLAGQEPPGPEEFPPIWDTWNAKDPQAQATDALRADQATLERLESMDADERARLHLNLFGMDIDTTGFARRARRPHLGRPGRARPGGHAGPGCRRPAHRRAGAGRGQEREAGRQAAHRARVHYRTGAPVHTDDGRQSHAHALGSGRHPRTRAVRAAAARRGADPPGLRTAGRGAHPADPDRRVELNDLRQIFRGF